MPKPFSIVAAAGAAVALAGLAAAQPPGIANARVTSLAAGTPFAQSFRALVSAQEDGDWIGYAVPAIEGEHVMCCGCTSLTPSGTTVISGTFVGSDGPMSCAGCRLDPAETGSVLQPPPRGSEAAPVRLEGPTRLRVLLRVANRQIDRIRVFSDECAVDADGRALQWLEDVRPVDSVALLESLVGGDGDVSARLIGAGLSAIALHGDAAAATTLQRLGRTHQAPRVRGEALFWVSQRGGAGADRAIVEAIERDPSREVRKKAVFALSQLKDRTGVDALIRVARSHEDSSTRGEALFWLGQKAGRQASEAITERIDQDPDTGVKKQAVFALSQLPKDEGVPLLIQVARTNTNPAVRKQAMFWLGQSKDPRAIDFFAEILK